MTYKKEKLYISIKYNSINFGLLLCVILIMYGIFKLAINL